MSSSSTPPPADSQPTMPSAGPAPGPAGPGNRPAWAGKGAPARGRYRLGPRLGMGGMGEVHEAWDTLLHRRVALKSLSVPYPAGILRFMREAQLQARVSHPNVCRIYDVDASEEIPFIAMQLVEGPNLRQAASGLAVDEVVEILAAVALAINAAHRLHLIHRDLKPSNILLEPDGMGGWSTYVADFGLAKDLAGEGLTEAPGVMGTPEFMPPELKAGTAGAVGPATDIYALGATLQAVLEASRGLATPGDPGAARVLPRKLRLIVGRCLEERPEDRYHSAGELAEDLRRFLDREPLLAERGEWRRQVRRFIRAHPTWTASLGLTLVLGTGFAVWTGRLDARGNRQAALAQRFALDARDMENRMRVERLIPVHDLGPAFARMRQGLDGIRRDMARLGPEAQGPGNLALGRGYCSLGDLDKAIQVLNRAWKDGYRTPEVAYALSRVACEYQFSRVDRAGLDGEAPGAPGADPSREMHQKEARRYFDLSQGQTWEPQDLGAARILWLEGRFQEALGHARAAFKENPWLYEAKVEEAFALTALGRARQQRGEHREALSLYREASLAATAARTIGQSDELCHLADLACRFLWMQAPGLSSAECLSQLDEAEVLADQIRVLRPESPRALTAKAFVLIRRASVLAGLGQDPEPELRRAEQLLAPVAGRAGFERVVALRSNQIDQVRARRR